MSYYSIVKQLLYLEALEKANREMWEQKIWPWNTRGQIISKEVGTITVERVMPAAVKGLDVEQQAEKENVQLPSEVKE